MALNPFGTPGVGQKQNDALQIPLSWDFHVGQNGIDARINSSVPLWEKRWDTQLNHLNLTSRLLRYTPWTLAWSWASPLARARVERFLRQSRSRFHPL